MLPCVTCRDAVSIDLKLMKDTLAHTTTDADTLPYGFTGCGILDFEMTTPLKCEDEAPMGRMVFVRTSTSQDTPNRSMHLTVFIEPCVRAS